MGARRRVPAMMRKGGTNARTQGFLAHRFDRLGSRASRRVVPRRDGLLRRAPLAWPQRDAVSLVSQSGLVVSVMSDDGLLSGWFDERRVGLNHLAFQVRIKPRRDYGSRIWTRKA